MNNSLLPALIIIVLTLAGCAGHSKVIVDTYGINLDIYQKDLAECQQLANQVESNVVEGIVGGAIVGAIIGGISGRHNKGHHYRHRYKHHNEYRLSASSSAKLGAVSGGLLAGSGAVHQSNRVLKNCIADRGYRVLN